MATIEGLLQQLDTLLLVVCAFGALAAAATMLFVREPMRVALALEQHDRVDDEDHHRADVDLVASVWKPLPAPVRELGDVSFGISAFSVAFLTEYWLLFELTSVLLVAAVVAAIAVLGVGRKDARHG
jgi:NADH:ubiquinone oxidoreductase subunit 6 (subunit J)